jgi:hypothetical protein
LYTTTTSMPPLSFAVSFKPTTYNSAKLGVGTIDSTYHAYLSPKSYQLPAALQSTLSGNHPNAGLNKFYTSFNRCQAKSFVLTGGDIQTYGSLTCSESGVLSSTGYVYSGSDLTECAQACYDYNQAGPSVKCKSFNKVYASPSPAPTDQHGCQLLACDIRDYETTVGSVTSNLMAFGWLDDQLTPECTEVDPTVSESYSMEYGVGCSESALSSTSVNSPTECAELCTANGSCNHFVITSAQVCQLLASCTVTGSVTDQFKYSLVTGPTNRPSVSPSKAPTGAPVPTTVSPTPSPTAPTPTPTTEGPSASPTTPGPTTEQVQVGVVSGIAVGGLATIGLGGFFFYRALKQVSKVVDAPAAVQPVQKQYTLARPFTYFDDGI